MKTKTRYIIIMAMCVIINEGLYSLASALGLPVWLDTTGTVLAAVFLEPAAGVLVGLVNNFYLAISRNDVSTLVYFFASASEAVIFGNLMRKNGKINYKGFLPAIGLSAVTASFIVSVITLWRNDGGLAMANDIAAYNFLTAHGMAHWAAYFIGPFAMKLLDVAAQGVIVLLLCAVIPNALKNPSDRRLSSENPQ